MRLINLKQADNRKVEKWLEESTLRLTPAQIACLKDSEMIRFAPFEFYERREKVKANIFWRLTIIAVPIYYAALIMLIPLLFLVTGKWGMSIKFHDRFHAPWMHKLKL